MYLDLLLRALSPIIFACMLAKVLLRQGISIYDPEKYMPAAVLLQAELLSLIQLIYGLTVSPLFYPAGIILIAAILITLSILYALLENPEIKSLKNLLIDAYKTKHRLTFTVIVVVWLILGLTLKPYSPKRLEI